MQLTPVLTVANGFRMNYDSSIKHLRYDLEDKKTENISAYFDMAAFQIDKCKIGVSFRSQKWRDVGALRGRSVTGKANFM